MAQNRRKFISTIAAASAGTAMLTKSSAATALFPDSKGDYPVYFFSKPLDKFENDFMGETLNRVGSLAGYDVTVRPGGKIEPQNVESDLPRFVETGKKYNLETKMIVSAFSRADDPHIDQVLRTASGLGVRHYRMGYIDYDKSMDVWEFLQSIKFQIIKLAEVNEKYGIQAGYQNHSGGPKFGTPLWDLWEILRDMPCQFISSQFDVRHAMVEGASTYILALKLLKDHIGSLAIKDFSWEVTNGKARNVHLPLGEGLVDFDLYFKTIKELGIKVPITLHVEYPLLNADEGKLPLLKQQDILVSKIKKDVDFVNRFLVKYQLA